MKPYNLGYPLLIVTWIHLARCYWHGPMVRALPALALMGVVAFQEFELAALLQTISWTDWFITGQRLGLQQKEMLRQSLWPMLWQLPVLVGVMRWIAHSKINDLENEAMQSDPGRSLSRLGFCVGVATIGMLLLAGCLIPLGLIGGRMIDGLVLLSRQNSQQWGLAREIAVSSAVAVCAGSTAWALSGTSDFSTGRATSQSMISGWNRKIVLAFSIPGLFGSLLLSLGCVFLYQQPLLRPLYDTPLPWGFALTVWLLPRAVLLRMWLHAQRNDEAVQLALMSEPGPRQRRLLWRLRGQPRFLAASVLCYWAYCDLPTSYLLAPTRMASGLVRLYNFMHFGRSAALSAEALVFFGTPLVVTFCVMLSLRWSK